MAKEYILRETALKAIHEEWDEVCNYDGIGHELANEMESVIDCVPAADVRPVVRGRWKKSYADHAAFGVRPFFCYCSECHEATVYRYNFCPNCGADMREVDDED